MRRSSLAAFAALMLTALAAQAQPRDSSRAEAPLEITLASAVRFGDAVVAAHRYRLSLTADGLALVDADSMLLVATVPLVESTVADSVAVPTAVLSEQGTEVSIVLRHLDRLYRAVGEKVELSPAEAPRVQLAAKQERLLEVPLAESKSERELVDRALRRYLSDVKHCADKAHRAHWQTDDPKFYRCVCPMTEKWRLPRVEHAIRVHRALAVGRHGFSFTVLPSGAVTECRVWAGVEPPAELAPDVASPPSTTPP